MGSDINDANRYAVHSLITKGIMFNSENDQKEVAVFFTAFGDMLLNDLVKMFRTLEIRAKITNDIRAMVDFLDSETDIFNLNVEEYYSMNSKLDELKMVNNSLRNNPILKYMNTEPVEEVECYDTELCCEEEPCEAGPNRGMIEGDFSPREGIASRYATKIVDPSYYGSISANDDCDLKSGDCCDSGGSLI
jgi:hypothetical protein